MQNLHTHTVLSDGKDTAREMVERAIELGFSSIGFSDHAPTVAHGDEETDIAEYIKTIKEVREEYGDRIEILLGIELDYCSAGVISARGFDYSIGSVHIGYTPDGRHVSYDYSAERSRRCIEECFGGDAYAYARSYYEKVATLPDVIDFDIVGHFDVVSKYTEKYDGFFDTGSPVYRNMALEALHAIREKKEVFEINTGAIGRGYRTTPYPAPFILREMRALDCKMVLSSDCHNRDFLTVHFEEARELLRTFGFGEIYELEGGIFKGKKI